MHSSSDGQKFEAAIPTINARHSAKYFRLNKGVVAYTLLTNHVPLNARIIGANVHESHFVFDILFNNATDILSAVHSTDTHGTNHVNFALLHQFGCRFAPRYRNVQRQVKNGVCGFRHTTHYDKDWPHQAEPSRPRRADPLGRGQHRADLALAGVEDHDPERDRRKTERLPPQEPHEAGVVGARWNHPHPVPADYIDSPVLRRNVQKALNRGEAYHQLRRAIAYA